MKPEKNLDLQDIAEVAIVTSASEVNRLIDAGWLLLALSSDQYAEHGYQVKYHLGWRRSLGEIKRVKTDRETWLSEKHSDANDASPKSSK